MSSNTTFIAGFGTGAALMYLLDPDRGNRRRALLRDQLVRAGHKAEGALGTTTRDLRNRAAGAIAETRGRLTHRDVDDEVLVGRVRTELGRVCSHPSSIEVIASNGNITLNGPVLADEVDDVLRRVRGVRGVEHVHSNLEVHPEAGNVPGLQGGKPREGDRFELRQEHWSPTARLLVGLTGATAAIYAARRNDSLGAAVGAAGLALLTRSVTNVGPQDLAHGRIDISKSVRVNAPVDQVFAFWSDYRNFPMAMSHVKEVREIGPGRSHWVVDGPAGVPVEWDAEVTEQRENEVLAWKSVPGSTVWTQGSVRFAALDDGGTRIDVRLAYEPPAGKAGHALASLLGADPKRRMEDDLVRLKTAIESGSMPRDAAANKQEAKSEQRAGR